jgi:CelD/BcsL family acetyltransferase involved in cellulose biosynthesis
MVDSAVSARTCTTMHEGALPPPAEAVVFRDIGAVEADWRDLEARGNCGPAQSFEWVRCWRDHVNQDCMAAVLQVAGRSALILPVEVVRSGPWLTARFPGGSHANCNFAACSPTAPSERQAMHLLVEALRRERPDIDLLRLDRQVEAFGGAINPLLVLGRMPHADFALAAPLDQGFEAVLAHNNAKRRRKKHRQHGKRYEEAGGWRIARASDTGTVAAILDRFFEMKTERFATAGIHDVFADPAVRRFLRALHGDDAERGRGAFFVEALEVGGRIIAVNGLSSWKGTTTVDFAAFSEEDALSTSPGEFMFYEEIAEACQSGATCFSFGVGDEPYKRDWCEQEIPLYDTIVPLTAKGAVMSGLATVSGTAKRVIKHNPRLWAAAKKLRSRLNGRPVAREP